MNMKLSSEALRIHREAILVDGHNDLPGRFRSGSGVLLEETDLRRPQPDFHTDIPRLLEGGIGAQFWAVYVPFQETKKGNAAKQCLEQIDIIKRMAESYPDVFEMAYSPDDIVRIRKQGKIASLIGVEGGHVIENSLDWLRTFYRLGGRYLTLTHFETIDWADSGTDAARHGGLTTFGEEVIQEMNRLGMMVDISHVSVDTMRDVLRVSHAPVIASHSSAYALTAVQRNVPDEILTGVAEKGGVVMVNFYPGFLTDEGVVLEQSFYRYKEELDKNNTLTDEDINRNLQEWFEAQVQPVCSLERVVDHIDHIVNVAGIDAVGLGSDFDGITSTPTHLEDVSYYPYITQELLNRGYGEEDIHKILGKNLLRVFRIVEEMAEK